MKAAAEILFQGPDKSLAYSFVMAVFDAITRMATSDRLQFWSNGVESVSVDNRQIQSDQEFLALGRHICKLEQILDLRGDFK